MSRLFNDAKDITDNMRILMISDVYFPRINGVSTSIQTFAHEFTQRGHQVTLIAPDYDQPAPEEPFTLIRLPSRYLPFDPEDRIMRWGFLKAHHANFAADGYDLVHIHTPFIAHYVGLALARRLRVPVVESYHTFFEHYLEQYVPLVPGAWLRWVARRFARAQCDDVDALAIPSQAMREVLHSYGVETRAEVIPTGINLQQFSHGDGARFRQRYGIAPERPLLIHVGRLAFEKNIEFLLRMVLQVIAQQPDLLFAIAGEGPARRSLEALAHQLGIEQQVLFVGYLARDGSLEDCYCAGDVFVFASRTETQGLVVLESMALGTPVVSTAVMGTQEVLSAGEGCLIATEDETDFAQQTLRVLQDRTLRQRLSVSGRQYAQNWSAPVLATRMLDFYGRVIDRHGEH